MRRFLMAAALGALAVSGARAQGTDATVDHAVSAYAKVKTMRASFTQTVNNALTGAAATSRGELLVQRPARFAMRFTEPKGDRIVGDGESVWMYLPSTNPGQAIRVSERDAGALDFTNELLRDIRARYTIGDAGTATVDGRPAHALTLVPKQNGAQSFTKAVIWVDDADGLIRRFDVTDASGVERRVTLQGLQVNVPVSASAFRFTPPDGVKVFDQSGR